MKSFLLTMLLAAMPLASLADSHDGRIRSANGPDLQTAMTRGLVKFRNSHPKKNAPVKSSSKVIRPEINIIYDAPGEEKLYYRNTEGWDVSFDGYPLLSTVGGMAQRFRFDDTDVYMYNPLSTFKSDAWIIGDVTEDGLLFQFPQTILKEVDPYDVEEEYAIYYDINLFELYHDDEYGDYYGEIQEEGVDNEVLLKKMPDGSYQYDCELLELYDSEYDIHYQLPKYCIAATFNWDEDEYLPEWTFYGDFYINVTEFTGSPVSAPEGLQTETWTAVAEKNGYNFQVGFDGDDVYFQGLFRAVPDAWVKGKLEGNSIKIKSGDYIGVCEDTNLFCFFYAGPMDYYFNEDLWSLVFDLEAEEYGVLDYDKQAKKMTTDQGFALFSSPEGFLASDFLQKPTLMVQPADISKIPSDPEILDYVDYGYWGDYAAVEFVTNTVDAEGYWIGNMSDFSYRIISDGEPVIFTPGEDYPALEEDMEWIPYGFTDDWSIMTDPYLYGNDSHVIVYYHAESKIYTALQCRYVDPATGEAFVGEPIVFWGENPNVSVDTIDATSEGTEIYNLQGVKMRHAERGLNIIRRGDKTMKIMVK